MTLNLSVVFEVDLDSHLIVVAQAGNLSDWSEVIFHYTTGVIIWRDPSLATRFAIPSAPILPEIWSLSVEFVNQGSAGAVLSPRIEGVSNPRLMTIVPSIYEVRTGGTFNVTINFQTFYAATSGPFTSKLIFFVGSAREGEYSIELMFEVERPSTQRTPTSPWPTDISPALAVLLGALLTAFAALALSPSRRLARVCPACEHKAPRFDTFMNPSCTECGETLAPRKGAKR